MSNWVKVFNSLPAHLKILRAGDRAAWLYICGLCYANEHLTDGFLAREVLPSAAPGVKGLTTLAGKLVAVGLWEVTEGGWQIHDYTEVQRSSEQVKESRDWDTGRKALMRNRPLVKAIQERDQDMCRYCGVDVDWTDRRSPTGATYDHVIPRQQHTFENVVVACRGCNFRKGPRTPEEAGMVLRPAPVLDRGSNPDLTAVQDREEERREEQKQNPHTPPGGGQSEQGRLITFRRRPVTDDARTLAEAILHDFNQQAGTRYGAYTAEGRPSEDLKRILGALSDAAPPLTATEAAAITRWRLAHPFWQGRPHTGVVFGPNVFPSNRESAVNPTTNTPSSADIAAALARNSTTPAA